MHPKHQHVGSGNVNGNYKEIINANIASKCKELLTKDFYKLIDNELDVLLDKYKEGPFIKKHRSAVNNQKSYVLQTDFIRGYGYSIASRLVKE